MIRTIRFDDEQKPDVVEVPLHKVVGYAPMLGVLVYETPDGKRYGVYLRTGAHKPADKFERTCWVVDDVGQQKEIVAEVAKFVDPPTPPMLIDTFGQPGD